MGEDRFFKKTQCDRCNKQLDGIRIMSMFNTDCICMLCAEKERKEEGYDRARDAEDEEIRKGNYNSKGIGRSKSKK